MASVHGLSVEREREICTFILKFFVVELKGKLYLKGDTLNVLQKHFCII